jgi:hypothetical protein
MYQRAKEDEKRVLTCDRQIIDALEEPGFAIADDKDSATVAGEMKIDIIQPAESKEFFLRITLLTGEKLDLGIRRRVLVDAVEDAARSICARRPEAVAGVFRTFDAIFELAPIMRELFGHFVDPAWHIATDYRREGHPFTDMEFMRGHRAHRLAGSTCT